MILLAGLLIPLQFLLFPLMLIVFALDQLDAALWSLIGRLTDPSRSAAVPPRRGTRAVAEPSDQAPGPRPVVWECEPEYQMWRHKRPS